MIPKILHQIWIGVNSMDEVSLECTQRIKKLYESAGWKYIFHGNNEFNYYYNNVFTDTLKTFCKNNNVIYAEEIMKFLILKEYGGFISDTDNFPIQVAPDSILNNEFVIAKYPCFYNNSFIGSTTDNEVINYFSLIDNIEKNCVDVLNRNNITDLRITGNFYYNTELERMEPSLALDIMGPIYVSDTLLRRFPGKYYALNPITNFINILYPVKYTTKNLTEDVIQNLITEYPEILNVHFGEGNKSNGWLSQCVNETNLTSQILD